MCRTYLHIHLLYIYYIHKKLYDVVSYAYPHAEWFLPERLNAPQKGIETLCFSVLHRMLRLCWVQLLNPFIRQSLFCFKLGWAVTWIFWILCMSAFISLPTSIEYPLCLQGIQVVIDWPGAPHCHIPRWDIMCWCPTSIRCQTWSLEPDGTRQAAEIKWWNRFKMFQDFKHNRCTDMYICMYIYIYEYIYIYMYVYMCIYIYVYMYIYIYVYM